MDSSWLAFDYLKSSYFFSKFETHVEAEEDWDDQKNESEKSQLRETEQCEYSYVQTPELCYTIIFKQVTYLSVGLQVALRPKNK